MVDLNRQIKKKIYGQKFSAWLITANVSDMLSLKVCEKRLGRRLEWTLRKPYLEVHGLRFREILECSLTHSLLQDMYWIIGQGKADTLSRFTKHIHDSLLPLILAPATTIGIQIKSYGSRLYHEGRLKESTGQALQKLGFKSVPWMEASNKLLIVLRDNQVSIGLSMAGQPLYQRGYRCRKTACAPMAEHLAATLIQGSLSISQDNFPNIYVPFAGSGTLGFETAIFLKDMVGVWERDFAFEQWQCFPQKTFGHIKSKQRLKVRGDTPQILFTEQHQQAIQTLEANRIAFLKPLEEKDWNIRIIQEDSTRFTNLPFPPNEPLFIPINPPWGERLQLKNAANLYQSIAELLNQWAFRSVSGFIISPNRNVHNAFESNLNKKYTRTSFSFDYGGSERWITNFHTTDHSS